METIKIDVQPHRRYNFRSDLEIDWRWIYYEEPEAEEYYNSLDEKYYCFNLDCYEHSCIVFSLVIDRKNLGYYEFDRARNVWIIAIPREMVKNNQEAAELARNYIEDYNSELNGRDEEEYE